MEFSANGKSMFTLSEASKFWGSAHYTRIAIHRLARKGWICPIEKGKYLIIPFEAGKSRNWSENPFLIANTLASPSAIAYWSAIRHWNWTEQLPRIVYIQTPQRKNTPRRAIFGVTYEVITVTKKKFFGHIKEWQSGKAILITDKEKTLVDCADDVERAGSIEELVKAVKSGASEISWSKLNEYVHRFPNGAVPKRLGYLFETLVSNLPEEAHSVLQSWQKQLTAGVVPLQPSRSKAGKIATRWRVNVNATIA